MIYKAIYRGPLYKTPFITSIRELFLSEGHVDVGKPSLVSLQADVRNGRRDVKWWWVVTSPPVVVNACYVLMKEQFFGDGNFRDQI